MVDRGPASGVPRGRGRWRVAVVFRGQGPDAALNPRLYPMVDALAAHGMDVVRVGYVEGREAETAARLSAVDGVLVWVDPLSDDGDRRGLDEVLRETAAAGAWVSAHPDVVDRLGTKDVLVDTRQLSWGCDVHVYRTVEQFCSEFPDRLARHGVRVLKASRGNGGRTVWKVRVPSGPVSAALTPETEVEVQHARMRDGSSASMPLAALLDRCAEAFDAWGGTAGLVDQEFVGGITRGIVRCYLVGGSVVGFARQYPEGAVALGVLDVTPDSRRPARAVMGLPSPKTMYPADEPGFRGLRALLETDWVPGAVGLLGLGPDDLPALWDIDLLIADPEAGEVPRFVLCEVNVSSVIPFPPAAPPRVASHVIGALERHLHKRTSRSPDR